MKKIVFVLLSFVLVWFACDKDSSPSIPMDAMDYNFKYYLLQNFDLNKDGVISFNEAELVKEIDCPNREIYSIEGIQYFPNVESINCSDNYLLTIDISQNQKLKILDITNHGMSSLDFTDNKSLKELYCSGPLLHTLDVSYSALDILDYHDGGRLVYLNLEGCNALKSLTCLKYGEPLSLDLSYCTSLEQLNVTGTDNLDISRCLLLQTLHYSGNFSLLDLRNNPALEDLKVISLRNGKTGAIDLSNNFKLVNCEIDLTLSNSGDFNSHLSLSHCKNLKSLQISTLSGLVTLDVSECTSLENVNLWSLNLNSLNVTGCTALSSLSCIAPSLTELFLKGCINLLELNCFGNPNGNLMELNLKDCSNLLTLNCRANNLTDLDLEVCTRLTYLDCSYNKLTSLKTNSVNLAVIHCENNAITEINPLNHIGIKRLNCDENNMIALDLTGCQSLEELYCRSNLLESLNLTDCKSLEQIYCSNGLLSTLDVSPCSGLITLHCNSNRLHPSLDVSKCVTLSELNCSSNPDLAELTLNRNHSIKTLNKDTHTQIVLQN